MSGVNAFENITVNELKQAYIFYGPEDLPKKAALESIRKTMLPVGLEALNESILEGVSAAKIIDDCGMLPVMAEKRLVLVRDWQPLMSGESSSANDERQRIIEWLKTDNPACCLIFYMRGEVKVTDKIKSLTALNPVEFAKLSEIDLFDWITKRLAEYKKTASRDAMRQIILTVGHELSVIDNELSKLTAYVGDRSNIEVSDVAAIISPSTEFGAYDMINKLYNGDSAGAYDIILKMIESGEARIRIIASITGQIRGMAYIKYALESGATVDQAAKDFGLHPYRAKMMAQNVRKFSSSALQGAYMACVDADYSIKSGLTRDDEALSKVFLQISSMFGRKAQQNR